MSLFLSVVDSSVIATRTVEYSLSPLVSLQQRDAFAVSPALSSVIKLSSMRRNHLSVHRCVTDISRYALPYCFRFLFNLFDFIRRESQGLDYGFLPFITSPSGMLCRSCVLLTRVSGRSPDGGICNIVRARYYKCTSCPVFKPLYASLTVSPSGDLTA
jgi:hypothetical protein